MYWLLEENPVEWTEENVGEKFRDLWIQLKEKLINQKMPNYFIPRSNMFANIPSGRLALAHAKVHKINEKPVMFILSSLQKLHTVKQNKDFYPMFDVEDLHKILTMPQENIMAEVNPLLSGLLANANGSNQARPEPYRPEATGGDRYQKKMRQKR